MILFVRTGALGDFCITLPVLSALFATGARVDVMCQPRFGVLARAVGSPGRVWDAGGAESLWLFGGKQADAGGYTLGVAFTAAHAEALTGLGIPDVRWVEARPAQGVRAIDHFCSVWPGGPKRQPARPLKQPGPTRGPTKTVVIAPGSSSKYKCWPMERWREVAAALTAAGVDVRWIGGPLEPWATDRPDLAGLLALATECSAWLGADSGPAHLAAWSGARVGVVAREESRLWLPDNARMFEWDAAPGGIADWVFSAR